MCSRHVGDAATQHCLNECLATKPSFKRTVYFWGAFLVLLSWAQSLSLLHDEVTTLLPCIVWTNLISAVAIPNHLAPRRYRKISFASIQCTVDGLSANLLKSHIENAMSGLVWALRLRNSQLKTFKGNFLPHNVSLRLELILKISCWCSPP